MLCLVVGVIHLFSIARSRLLRAACKALVLSIAELSLCLCVFVTSFRERMVRARYAREDFRFWSIPPYSLPMVLSFWLVNRGESVCCLLLFPFSSKFPNEASSGAVIGKFQKLSVLVRPLKA